MNFSDCTELSFFITANSQACSWSLKLVFNLLSGKDIYKFLYLILSGCNGIHLTKSADNEKKINMSNREVVRSVMAARFEVFYRFCDAIISYWKTTASNFKTKAVGFLCLVDLVSYHVLVVWILADLMLGMIYMPLEYFRFYYATRWFFDNNNKKRKRFIQHWRPH